MSTQQDRDEWYAKFEDRAAERETTFNELGQALHDFASGVRVGIMVNRIALAVVCGCVWGWYYAFALLIACWLGARVLREALN